LAATATATATTASAALESTELDELPSGSPVAEPNQELEIGNVFGQKNTDDPNIEDYSCKSGRSDGKNSGVLHACDPAAHLQYGSNESSHHTRS
jgi:hypothetical protein